MKNNRKIICVDFDGVLHSYTSGWQGADVISDLPVPGAIEWLTSMAIDHCNEFEMCIYSSRSSQEGGIAVMKKWLLKYGITAGVIALIDFPTQKPGAWLTIDDRAICFNGVFPTPDDVHNFVPWNKPREYSHVDDFIYEQPRGHAYARFVLHYFRLPAILKSQWAPWMAQYKLFCDYQEKRYRVTGASRLGDVWLAENFYRETGYDLRVNVTKCRNWGEGEYSND